MRSVSSVLSPICRVLRNFAVPAAMMACGVSHGQTGSFTSSGINMGAVAVHAATPATTTLTFQFTAGGTISAPAVLMLGAPNLDFTDAGTGTCTTNGTSHVYNAGDTCTVAVYFTPRFPGARDGAVVLSNSSNEPIGTAYIYGSGTGPQAVLSPGVVKNLGGSFTTPEGFPTGVAVDGNGNVYVTRINPSLFSEVPAGCVSSDCVIAIDLLGPLGVAFDGAGNLYVSRLYGNAGSVVDMLRPGCVSSSCAVVLGNALSYGYIEGLAVDGAGNVYESIVRGTSASEVVEISAGCLGGDPNSSACKPTGLGGGFGEVFFIAVDGAGNIYASDFLHNAVYKMPPGCTSSACAAAIGGTIDEPAGLAVDASGTVYVGSYSKSKNVTLEEIQAGCASASCVVSLGFTLGKTSGVALDANGNLYVAKYQYAGDGEVVELDRTDPDSVSFSPTLDGSTSAQAVQVQNIGTSALTFPPLPSASNPSLSGSDYFTLDSSGTNACPLISSGSESGGTLGAGSSCALPISFSPGTGFAGTASGSVQITDDSLNAPAPGYAVQTTALSGTGGPPAILTVVANAPLMGTVTSSPAGIICGGTCLATFVAPEAVVLTATPNSGFAFGGWSGCDSSSGDTCTVAMAEARTVTAIFATTNQPVGAMDQPLDATTHSTTVGRDDDVVITGWAADPQTGATVTRVTVTIGSAGGNATLGLTRPGVVTGNNNNFAYYNSGWIFTCPASELILGRNKATAVISDSLGETTKIGPRFFTVAASPSWGPPFGAMSPTVDAATRSTIVAQNDNLLVSGWAADPHDGAPVSSVSILIDGATVGTATLGIPWPSVAAAQNNPGYLLSGWTFSMAASGLSAGTTHTVSAVAADSLGQSTTLGSQTITVAASSPDGPPFGSLDKAVDATTGQTPVSESDNLLVEGWAGDVHDGAPVSQVSILIDGTAVGHAMLGIARPDVAKNRGSQYANSGWKLTMAASSLSAGPHTVTAVASDSLGLSTQLQIREITVTP